MKPPKLTREQALEIRRAYAAADHTGAGASVLAARFGVSTATIYAITTGRHALVAGAPPVRAPRRLIATMPSKRPSPAQLKSAGLAPARLSRNQSPCPKCGAGPGQACTNQKAVLYPKTLSTPHRERRATRL